MKKMEGHVKANKENEKKRVSGEMCAFLSEQMAGQMIGKVRGRKRGEGREGRELDV